MGTRKALQHIEVFRGRQRDAPNARRCVGPTRARSGASAETSCPSVGGKVLHPSVSHSRPIFTSSRGFDSETQFGTRRSGVTIKNCWGTFCTGNRTYFRTPSRVAECWAHKREVNTCTAIVYRYIVRQRAASGAGKQIQYLEWSISTFVVAPLALVRGVAFGH